MRALPLSVTQKRALVALVDRDFANGDYGALNALDRDGSYRELSELVARGHLTSSGAGAGTRYRVVKSAAPPQARTPLERLVDRMTGAGFLTNTDYRDAFGVDSRGARLALARWARAGVLVRAGDKRGARYLPGSAWPPVEQAETMSGVIVTYLPSCW